jgi:DNA end-binding protein Ku
MEALKQSISAETAPKQKKGRKASSGQKEMLMSVSSNKPAKKAAKKSAKSDRRSA